MRRKSSYSHSTDSHPTHSRPFVDVADVSVIAAGTTLLAPTSLQVGAGEIVALRGPNGSGKTTLLRVLAGRTSPTSGRATIDGRPIDEREPAFRRRVAAMIGLPPMAPDLTVVDHVALISSTWEASAADAHQAASRALDSFGLSGLATRFPHELSSGQTQLFGLALAFVRPCEVLLLDEPEQRLDPDRVDLLAHAMLARQSAGTAIVLATHSDALAARTAGRTLTLTSAA